MFNIINFFVIIILGFILVSIGDGSFFDIRAGVLVALIIGPFAAGFITHIVDPEDMKHDGGGDYPE